ncbi:MAG: response regulator transcription factor [Anaeromicrobium sp.]|jgi:two-component system alkaline phosphatase synthesis response regulator PhoP|uniref:response regulator transcription factor n=1 Tax=Anaeromicrobium sp. TaxID=1929132 RepID=UPI0025F0895F|nr:response regulator transcription factor [Anaeromicrobium sp.]MCT4592909.1 response regulator transcription factor [Anaeromicrobium sp.]
MKKILVVDDEEYIRELIEFNLKNDGYEVITSEDGYMAIKVAKEEKPDLILLDLMLPKLNGFEVCKEIRVNEEIGSTPIIMLTAKNDEGNKIEGLDAGADDYVTKPFSVKELLARVRAVLRRYDKNHKKNNEIVMKDLIINLDSYEVRRNEKKIDLTNKEFELLKVLIENRGKVLTRNFLLDHVWGYDYFGDSRTVDVHIRYLRKKIEDTNNEFIETVRGAGYILR